MPTRNKFQHQYSLIQRNCIFIAGLSIAVIYWVFLCISLVKIVPGFVMQFIFLGENAAHSFSDCLVFFTSSGFLINISAGIALATLLFCAFQGAIKSMHLIIESKKYIAALPVSVKTSRYSIFRSDHPQVFTAGLLHPRIYLSQQLLAILKPYELEAVILHEQVHQKNHDPLKDWIIRSLFYIIPPFPCKQRLLQEYQVLVEVTCDEVTRRTLRSEKSIVKAIVALMKAGFTLSLPTAAYFTPQSERLQILLGLKKHYALKLLGLSVVTLLLLTLGSFAFSKSHLFFECDHLARCIKIFLSELKQQKIDQREVILSHKTNPAERCSS